ncbi:MAG: GMC family oxidoreductase [Polyangiaceae bacterium]|nr:GMC family oxidoreductase [Polyangiaceae bacterium]
MKGFERAAALAAALLPAGSRTPGADAETLGRARAFLDAFGRGAGEGFTRMLTALDDAALLYTGKRFSSLSPDRQDELLRRWEEDPVLKWPLVGASFVLKSVHFDDPAYYEAMGTPYRRGGPAAPARWLRQVIGGESLTADQTVECDVVVIGTGAGGGIVGRELAERGLAVVFLEEGRLYRRDAFNGNPIDAHRRFYRGRAGVVSVGNTVIPVLMGRLVGGSTAINTGTCFRTPDWILSKWCDELGTDAFSPEAMRRHFEAVEALLHVAPARPEVTGGPGRVIARGCDALGWSHFALRRNAPDCDAQGVCDFGGPSDARRSTNISCIPPALERGAVLYTHARAERLLVEQGRAVGVEASTGQGRKLTVRARAVVLAGGAIPSPLFLLSQDLCNASGQVGRNLSLHPATAVSALFDEPIRGYETALQGYGVDQFHRDGILLLGASPPLSLGAAMLPFNGRRLTEIMDRFDQVCTFGVMIEDESRGRVRRGPGGRPLLTYWIGEHERDRLQRGMARLAEIYFAAGARRVMPMMAGAPILENAGEVTAWEARKRRAAEFFLTSFHPLGTCRMGSDPRKSVVGLDHQTHAVRDLYIVDGSTVPGPPAVNPQETIMAMAHRASELLAARLT